MNKIYKVIWSKAKKCYVVVSEIAKHNGKCSSSLNKKIIASFLAAGLVTTIIPKDAEAWYIKASNGTIVIAGRGDVNNKVGGSGDRLGTVWGSNTSAEAAWATAFGSNTVASSTNATAWGNGARATGNHATAFGHMTTASGPQATAFGFKTQATADNATAFGHQTKATANRATAFGISTQATGRNATSYGFNTIASGENGTAWGSTTEAVGAGATAFGRFTQARADNSVTWGSESIVDGGHVKIRSKLYDDLETLRYSDTEGDTTHYYIMATDRDTKQRVKIAGRYGDDIVEGGFEYKDSDSDAFIGPDNGTNSGRIKADNWIIRQEEGRVAGQYSTAFGDSSKVYARNALGALGGTVQIGAHNSAAIGVGSVVSSVNSYAMGNGATIGTDSEGSVALGGTTDSKQTKIGEGATNAFAAVGGQVGNGALQAIAIGQGTVVGKAVSSTDNTDKGKQSVAIGVGNEVTGNNSIAVGTGLTVSGDNSGAFGDPSEINSANSYSVGNENKIGTGYTDVFALGNHITRVERNSVFLGSNSGYVPADNSTTAGVSTYGSMTINDHVYPFAGGGNSVAGVVSVGNNVDGKITTRRIQNVAPGLISAKSTDAINGSQLYQAMQALSIEVKGDPTDTRSTKVDVSNPPATETAPAAGGDTPGGTAGTTMEIKLTPATTYTVTASTTTAKAGSKNIKVLETIGPDNPKSYKYTIDLARDIEVDSVTAGNTVMNNDGVTIKNGPSMTKDGIDAGGKKITNVAPGENDTDAVNVSQLRDYAAGNSQAINTVDSRARKGVAGAAALAALHPLDFDPDDKLTFAAGMANFRGETAAAIGAFYRPDEKVMFSVGGTFGNGENLVNAGVSFSLDRTPRVTGSRTALTKEVVALREHVARQDAQIAELTALVRQLAGNAGVNMPAASSLPAAMPAMFPDNLDNKWAYDKLEELEQQGYIKGYAGHTLTRSQFAAALDMAMKRGAKLEERLVKAFEPELSHVRVAHVEGNGNEEGKWYERPRFSYDKLEKKHEIEKKNARIVPAKQK